MVNAPLRRGGKILEVYILKLIEICINIFHLWQLKSILKIINVGTVTYRNTIGSG